MSTFDYALIAVVLTMMFVVSASVMGFALYKGWKLLTKLEKSTAALSVECSRMQPYVLGVYQELVYMREIAAAQAGVQGNAAVGPQQTQIPRPPTPFPSPAFDRYQVEIPDATVEDTDIDLLNQTDEDLVEMEKLENMRQQGIEVEDSNAQHAAIVRDSE